MLIPHHDNLSYLHTVKITHVPEYELGQQELWSQLFGFISAFCFLPFSICLVYSFPSLIFNLIILFQIVIRTIKP